MTSTTLRMPSDMADAVKSEAAAKGTTVNDLVRSLIEAYLKSEDEKRLYEGFTLLGKQADCDVEYAIHAAAEVVLNDG